jgi:hypothetical protein
MSTPSQLLDMMGDPLSQTGMKSKGKFQYLSKISAR